jgi:hypothetical protein
MVDDDVESLFSFREGEWYSVRDLRAVAERILEKTKSDAVFSAAMSVNDQKAYPWAKAWMEEIFPASRLAAEIGLSDEALFKWTPVGAADVEFDRGTERLRIQCTTAYAERDGTVAAQGGHLRKLEMKEANKTGMVWLGGALNQPRTVDVNEAQEAWRFGISAAINKKLKLEYLGCRLLIYAPRCSFDLVDGDDFRNVITDARGSDRARQMGEIFERLYVVDLWPGKFVELPA